MSGQAGKNSNSTTLSGSAFVKTEAMEINADRIELSGDDYRKITAAGSVSGKNIESKMEFTCSTLSYDRETKTAVLEGNVKLVDLENDVRADAQLIEYNQNTEVAVLQIQIRLTQKDNVCTGSYAIYHKKEQLLDLSGNAQVKQNKDTFRAQQITLDLDSQEITLTGNVKGSVTTEAQEKQGQSDGEAADPAPSAGRKEEDAENDG